MILRNLPGCMAVNPKLHSPGSDITPPDETPETPAPNATLFPLFYITPMSASCLVTFPCLPVPPLSGLCLPDLAGAPGFPLWILTGFFLGEVNVELESIAPTLGSFTSSFLLNLEKGTSWSQRPVFAIELIFSKEPIPAPGFLGPALA